MQRRKSVRKRSYKVRGMRPPQGPTCVRILYGIHAKTITKKQKNLSLRKDYYVYLFFFGANREGAKCFIPYSNPYGNLGFLFCFCCLCMDHIGNPYASGFLRRPHPTYGIGSFAHTFSTLQKRPLLSVITYDILTQAGPKKLAKQVQKKSFGPA